MAKDGWIKLHRQIQEGSIWEEKPFDKRSAWIDLLLSANHADKKIYFNGNFFVVKRGQYLTSIRKLAERWGWSYDKCLRYLKLLEADGMLLKDSNKSRTLITIVNYKMYQDVAADDKPMNQKTDDEETVETDDSCSKNTNELQSVTRKVKEENLKADFEIIYKYYKKKSGKTKAYGKYKLWVTTGKVVNGTRRKLTNKQIWSAIIKYNSEMEHKGTELQFYKNFDTFMGDSILDYVEDEK